MFWGLNGPALGSRRVYAPCVNHLRHLRGSVGLWAAPSRTAAALRGGASPADAFPLLECTTEHGIRRKSIREAGQSLPRAWGGRSCSGENRRRGRVAVTGGARGGGCCGAPPGPWMARVDARRRCETVAGVREVQGSLKMMNCRGAGTHRRTNRAQFRRGEAWVPGQGTWGVPWGYGDALARVFRSSGAAGRRGRGGGCYALTPGTRRRG